MSNMPNTTTSSTTSRPSSGPPVDPGVAGRLIGVLMLAAFGLYGSGALLIDQPIGRVLVLLNSVAVWTIGLVAYSTLRERDPVTGQVYLATRLIEGILLLVGTVAAALPNGQSANDVAFLAGMAALGTGSMVVFRRLTDIGWVPSWLGWWGVIGYAATVLGCAANLLELAPVEWFLPLGSAFEVFIGLLLGVRGGFPIGVRSQPQGSPRG